MREIVAASYFGVNGPMSAFTIAFQVPNLVRSLFADAALQAAFVPVFTEQLEKRSRAEAFRVASALLFVIAVALGLDHGAVRPARAGPDAAVRARLRRGAHRPDGQPRAAAVPDRAPARAHRAWSSGSSTASTTSGRVRSRRCSGTSRSSRRWSS